MSHIRKITHRPRKDGSASTSWRLTWRAQDGKPRSKNFSRKADAQAYRSKIDAGLAGGSATMSVLDLTLAHYAWFDSLVKAGLREPHTRDSYGTQIDLHLRSDPAFASLRLSDLQAPDVQNYLDALLGRVGSPEIVRRMRRSLVSWCKFGQRKGWLIGNPAQPCKVERVSRPDAGEEKLQIPQKEELAALLRAAEEGENAERDTAVVRLLMFGGLRISELLGLADEAASPVSGQVKIRERLDIKYMVIGRVKSANSSRDIPIGPATATAVKAWRLRRGPSRTFTHRLHSGATVRVPGRLFPSPRGADLWGYHEFIRECWTPLLDRAGLIHRYKDAAGKQRRSLAFHPHALRHVAASLWIEQNLQPKKVQELLGHATLGMTMDLYGHLWRNNAEDRALAEASERLIPSKR